MGLHMMMSWHGNASSITGPLRGESICHQRIPLTKGQWWGDLIFSSLNRLLNKQLGGRRIEISWLSFEVSETISTDMIIFTLVFFKLSSDPFLWTGINIIEVGAWVNNYIQYTIHVLIWVNSSPSSAAYMCQWSGPALVQAMACNLFGTKPLLEPMLA